MKPYCQLCKTEGHWSHQCTRYKQRSHGEERSETDQSLLTRKVDEKPSPRRRQIVPGGLGEPVPPSVRSAAHHASRKTTPVTLAPATKIPATETPPTATKSPPPISVAPIISVADPPKKKAGRPKKATTLSVAERSRLYRQRKLSKPSKP